MKHKRPNQEYNIKLINLLTKSESEIKASSLISIKSFKHIISRRINLKTMEIYHLHRKINLNDDDQMTLYDIFRNNPNPIVIIKEKVRIDVDFNQILGKVSLEIRNFPTKNEFTYFLHIFLTKKGYKNQVKQVNSDDRLVLIIEKEEIAFEILKEINTQKNFNNLFSKVTCTLTSPMNLNKNENIQKKSIQKNRNDEYCSDFINSGVPYKSQFDYKKEEEINEIPLRIQKDIVITKHL